ncbi:hypothetical protein HA402_013589 [Bradysia odoriphaga]|nr:hypothetical protein HA402_013589 [Bradysia odoriphaga]
MGDPHKKFNGSFNASMVSSNGKGYAPLAMQYTKESIKQLVMEAETLVREDILSKTPSRNNRPSFGEMSVRKNGCDSKVTMSNPKIKRVQEWLHHQPSTPPTPLTLSRAGTDCEASGEYTTESDSVARDSDSSDGPSDSIATCLQDGGSNSQCTSTEVIGYSNSADPLNTLDNESNEMMGSMQQVTLRSKRRNSDRPHSVSCLSQLNDTRKVIRSSDEIANQGLANHSISESALNTLSSPATPSTVSHSTSGTMKTSESKSSLKKRRMRARKRLASESFSGQSTLMKDLSKALSMLSIPRKLLQNASSTSEMESEDDAALPKPKFQLGAYTSVYGSDIALKLGSSLAALANYNREGEVSLERTTSNFSEQAWDNYQEKYLSEAYSEGFDSDAARRLMEFGDDYRNFLDSQSDCCSSLSAANNFDSLSPPRNRKPRGLQDNNSLSNSPSGDDLTLRRRRTAEFESERRRKASDGARKVSSEESKKSGDQNSPLRRLSNKSSHSNAIRKLEHDFIAGLDKRKHDDTLLRRRLRSNDKSFSSSSSCSEPEDETELKTLLSQSKSRLENTDALRIRHHLLRPEDYAEIIATCRDNVHCLQTVLRGLPGDVLSNIRGQEIRELLSSWESLLHWSENASVARQLQEEMLVLKSVLNKLGNRDGILDSESSIQMSIDDLKNEKAQLLTHRSTMLRLNASVHSWLTRQEMKMEKSKAEITTTTTINDNSHQTTSVTALNCSVANEPTSKDTAAQFDVNFVDDELHKQLKNEVGDMYSTWDEADQRISSRLESLTTSLIAWKQFESGMTEFKEALGKDKGTLKGLTGALEMCRDDNEHGLAHDVKEVAKRLSERSESNIQQIAEQTKNIHLTTATAATAFNLKSTSNGSLSDSGMSDGGGSSDYSVSERERHLNVLRRLARQLESALAPGSAAIISISQRMEAAEADLRSLQDTCRALIVQTAATQNQNQYGTRGQMQDAQTEMSATNGDGEFATLSAQQSVQVLKAKQPKRFVQSKRKPRRRSNGLNISPTTSAHKPSPLAMSPAMRIPSPEPDPDDPNDELEKGEKDPKKWAWRLAKYAVPVQVALVALICAICCLEPNCCDAVNNFSMSFTPQLRYVKGPPPI